MTEGSEARDGHPPLDEMVGYVRRSLDRAGRERVERHLAACRLCANEIGDIVRLNRRKASWARTAPYAAVAAAAAALFLIVWTGRFPSSDTSAATREPPIASVAAPTPLAPAGSEAGRVVFRWAAAGGLRYRVVLFDSVGSALFEGTSGDTMLPLPDSIRLAPGDLYLWKVEAEVAPDRWVSSRLVQFRPSGEPPP